MYYNEILKIEGLFIFQLLKIFKFKFYIIINLSKAGLNVIKIL